MLGYQLTPPLGTPAADRPTQLPPAPPPDPQTVFAPGWGLEFEQPPPPLASTPNPMGGPPTAPSTGGGFPPQNVNKYARSEVPPGIFTQPLWHPPPWPLQAPLLTPGAGVRNWTAPPPFL